MSQVEEACLLVALNAKSLSANRRLHALSKAHPFENPLSELGPIKWEKSMRGVLVQVLLMILLLLMFLVAIPFLYFSHVLTNYLLKRKIKKELKAIKSTQVSIFNQEKTLCGLWYEIGLEDALYNEKEKMLVLKQWLPILYGDYIDINIECRISAIYESRSAANVAYYNGEPDAPHFHFVPAMQSLIDALSRVRSQLCQPDNG
ncbi:hypothetical protein CBP31_15110 [Oceanisphaera profunda]|uniref:Uncharacterized protein n=1 Tax=Oceanisphaera profunda TaxID=1416627 RepID=A0A1Y0D893_9GAMM|nr:hypothetical protein [Oceanisphaera profunda]ART83801.1 hypothetical protein CBP31_15110 [Oceanisphaera profunda]